MGIRSSVGIVLTTELNEVIKTKSEEEIKFLSYADNQYEKDGAILYVFEDVKWCPEDLDLDSSMFFEMLNSEDEDGKQFYIVEACSEYPSNENTWGVFYDNPFELGTSYTLSYNEK